MLVTNEFITAQLIGWSRGKNRAKNIPIQKLNGVWTKVNIMGYLMHKNLNKELFIK